jgi:hypothetical protein
MSDICSGVNAKGLNKIVQEISYLKDKETIELKRKYNIFAILLNNRKRIKNIKDGTSRKEMEEITQISKRTRYRLKKQLKTKDWKGT